MRKLMALSALAVLFGCLLLPGSAAQGQHPTADGARLREVDESKTFHVSGVPRVVIETFDGSITIHGWDRPEVMFAAVKLARDDQEMRGISLRSEQSGGRVLINASFNSAFGREVTFNGHRVLSNSASAELEVYVPRKVYLQASSGDGRISVESVAGELDLFAKDGTVEASNVSGSLRVRTCDGRIDINNFDGAADVRSDDGPLNLEGRFTKLEARTKDGEISLELRTDVNATIETRAELVSNQDGVAVAEGVRDSRRNVRRWKVGAGGNTFELSTEKGSIYLRRSSR